MLKKQKDKVKLWPKWNNPKGPKQSKNAQQWYTFAFLTLWFRLLTGNCKQQKVKVRVSG